MPGFRPLSTLTAPLASIRGGIQARPRHTFLTGQEKTLLAAGGDDREEAQELQVEPHQGDEEAEGHAP